MTEEYLEQLLASITEENRHEEVDLGPAVGREWPACEEEDG